MTQPTDFYLVDSNVLVADVDTTHLHHNTARTALTQLGRQNVRLCIAPQNLIEFWVAATRPASANGLGLSPIQATASINGFLKSFTLLPDTPQVFAEWQRIVLAYSVLGRQAHDARLAAFMCAHHLTHLLTFNGADFRRFEAAESFVVIDPATLIPPEPTQAAQSSM